VAVAVTATISAGNYSYYGINARWLMDRRLDIPFYIGADEPLLGQAMDASYVSRPLEIVCELAHDMAAGHVHKSC
jgi:inosine-uridine nucleoside N-ribohydrolase